jgi:hypothetical protein
LRVWRHSTYKKKEEILYLTREKKKRRIIYVYIGNEIIRKECPKYRYW